MTPGKICVVLADESILCITPQVLPGAKEPTVPRELVTPVLTADELGICLEYIKSWMGKKVLERHRVGVLLEISC